MFPTIDKCIYTPYYCEENVYKLAESLPQNLLKESFAVFISNESEKCPLWRQKNGSPDSDHMVCWDYHVILIHRPETSPESTESSQNSPESSSLVYDFDTTNPFPCPFLEYFNTVFHPGLVNHYYVQQFRVIPAADYLKSFSSDRSRMKRPDGSFIEPPPKYECIQNNGEMNNLNDFINMNPQVELGKVLSLSKLYAMFS